MFLHQGIGHLLANIQTLLFFGRDVHHDIGHTGLYGVFLLAGATAGANKWGRIMMTESQLEGSIPRAPERIGPLHVPSSAIAVWDKVRQQAAQYTAPLLHERIEAFGASGAACGLMGYSCMVGLNRLLLWHHAEEPERNSNLEQSSANNIDIPLSLASLVQCTHFLWNELRLLRGAEGRTGVDHAGHLTGFVIGIGSYVILRAVKRLYCVPPATEGHSRRYVDSFGELRQE
jgi:membrane associated rhomboid family serine protease